jgi:hypothetical protein
MLAWLNKEAAQLLEEARQRVAGKPYAYDVSYFTLESTFCTYKSWHRPNRRYPGVYLDMFHDRIKKAESTWPEENFSLFWEARNAYLPAHLRLGDNPNDIIFREMTMSRHEVGRNFCVLSVSSLC